MSSQKSNFFLDERNPASVNYKPSTAAAAASHAVIPPGCGSLPSPVFLPEHLSFHNRSSSCVEVTDAKDFDDSASDTTSEVSHPPSATSDVATLPNPFSEPSDIKPGFRVRGWFLTIFRDEGFPNIPKSSIKYYSLTKELTPSTNRVHWHMYVEFVDKKSIAAVKAIFGDNTINCQPRRGTIQQADDYIFKRNQYAEKSSTRFPGFEVETYGVLPHQGARTDLDFIVDAVFAGATKKQLLHHGGGNVLRHLGMIDRAQRAVHGYDYMDNIVLQKHRLIGEINSNNLRNGKPTLKMEEAFDLLPQLKKNMTSEEIVVDHRDFVSRYEVEDTSADTIQTLKTATDELVQFQSRPSDKKSLSSSSSDPEKQELQAKRGRPKKLKQPTDLLKCYKDPFGGRFFERTFSSILDALKLDFESTILVDALKPLEFYDLLELPRPLKQSMPVPEYLLFVSGVLREHVDDLLHEFVPLCFKDPPTESRVEGICDLVSRRSQLLTFLDECILDLRKKLPVNIDGTVKF